MLIRIASTFLFHKYKRQHENPMLPPMQIDEFAIFCDGE